MEVLQIGKERSIVMIKNYHTLEVTYYIINNEDLKEVL